MSGHITVVLVVLVCKCYQEFRRLVTHVSSPSASLAAALAQSTEPWPNLRNLTLPLSEQVVEDQFSDQKLPGPHLAGDTSLQTDPLMLVSVTQTQQNLEPLVVVRQTFEAVLGQKVFQSRNLVL